jgi:HPt (histidine-containing phosphotransfer) domain-containing protein
MIPMDSKTSASDSPSISAMLDQLWLKFRPQIEERVVVLEQAAAALAQGNLSPVLRAEAHSAAHKLAGSLGTFGLIPAGELARQAESICQSNPAADSATYLLEIAAALRAEIAARG